MIHYFIGNLGHLFVVLAFVTSLFTAFSYIKAVYARGDDQLKWSQNGRSLFIVHAISVTGIVVTLFAIIYNHYFEYHYAWSHSSIHLPTYYMISAFWEGQEGSFLLWIFWHAVLGIIIIATNKKWEAPVMAVFAMVQAFLTSMILGVVILNLKIGSSPFLLLRDVIQDPIFLTNPDFIPEDGSGLNPLLQNYWMVIHPPTLFLGFATTLVPFAFVIAGLWTKNYKSWIRPALPWTLFSAGILGLGIIMGAIWAYETLNFGGYWNWDPVENAVYVPWLFLIASLHTMITFKNSDTALKTSIVLVISMFVLILYSTFLTRSGILGDSSVHSFTDLGLSGQLLLYLLFFLVLSATLTVVRWKEIPSSEKEVSTYSREFWIFIGVATLALMGLQVIIPTSIPVFNAIVESFGGFSNMAPPADQIGYYSKFQIWFALAILILSGTGQFFWWKKMDAKKLRKELVLPLVVALLLSSVAIPFSGLNRIPYLLLFTAGVYSIVANVRIMLSMNQLQIRLSGGSIAHIGIALMLIGIMFSSGYSRIITMNRTGKLIHPDFPEEINMENVLLLLNEPRNLEDYEVRYRGRRLEARGVPGFIDANDVSATKDPYKVVALVPSQHFEAGDTLEISPENTYYEVEYMGSNGKTFSLFPRAQINEGMGGILASPDIKKRLDGDLYTHVSSIPDPEAEKQWSEMVTQKVGRTQTFFVRDYVSDLLELEQIREIDGVVLGPEDVAIQAHIRIQAENRDYTAKPVFVVKDLLVGRIPDEIEELGVRLTLTNVHPQEDAFTIGIETTQKDYIIMKAMVKPMINVLWAGTGLLLIGFGVALVRRYSDFAKMRDKELE